MLRSALSFATFGVVCGAVFIASALLNRTTMGGYPSSPFWGTVGALSMWGALAVNVEGAQPNMPLQGTRGKSAAEGRRR